MRPKLQMFKKNDLIKGEIKSFREDIYLVLDYFPETFFYSLFDIKNSKTITVNGYAVYNCVKISKDKKVRKNKTKISTAK